MSLKPPDLFRPVRWRWVHVGVAALAMVATLPGRTHGLGLFTVPILWSLDLDSQSYGFLNLWATLLGALFCLPCGWLIDRYGTRAVLLGVTAALGVVVVAMSRVTADGAFTMTVPLPGSSAGFSVVVLPWLFVFLLLTRGLGQSALSVVSLALIGRSARKGGGLEMGVYAFATAAGFLGAFIVLGEIVKHPGAEWQAPLAGVGIISSAAGVIRHDPDWWRGTWAAIGFGVIAAGLVGGLLVRNRYLVADPAAQSADAEPSRTLGQALRSPAFWSFALATSFYGLVVAGTSLYNQLILRERGFDKDVFVAVTRIGVPVGLAANLLTGWLAGRWPLHRILAGAMVLFGAALFAFPYVKTESQVYVYAVTLAAAGGVITVCFFAVWRLAFGPAHLGRIQGAAQMLTVIFSAVGPQLFASGQAQFGSYARLFPALAVVALALGVFAFLTPVQSNAECGMRNAD